MYAIEVDNLSKSHKSQRILREVTLRVAEGEVYGLVGARGTGKTTLLHLLLGFLKPTEGHIQVLGTPNLHAAHRRVGYMPQYYRYHLRYSARRYLTFLGLLSDLWGTTLDSRIDEELARVGLSNAANQHLSSFTPGMLQRFGIAQSMLTDPDLLLIDSPTDGLDTSSRQEILELLYRLRSQGHTIFLNTNHLDVAEFLCDRVGFLIGGRIVTEVNIHQVRSIGTSVNIQVNNLTPDIRATLSSISSAVQCGEYMVTLRPNSPALQATVLRTLIESGVEIIELESLERPLEHIYLEAMRNIALGLPPQPPAMLSASPIPPVQSSDADQLLEQLLQKSGDQQE